MSDSTRRIKFHIIRYIQYENNTSEQYFVGLHHRNWLGRHLVKSAKVRKAVTDEAEMICGVLLPTLLRNIRPERVSRPCCTVASLVPVLPFLRRRTTELVGTV